MLEVVEVLVPGPPGPVGPAGASTAEAAASAAAAASSASAAAASAAAAGAAVDPLIKTASYTVVSGDQGKNIVFTGASMGTLTYAAPAGYSTGHKNLIINESSRRWSVDIAGSVKWLWPGQSMTVLRNASAWQNDEPGLWMGVNGSHGISGVNGVRLFVDASVGNDDNDGLVAGVGGALLKVVTAIELIQLHFACSGEIKLAAGTHTPRGAGTSVAFYSGPSVGKQSNIITIYGDEVAGSPSRTSYILQCPAGGTCIDAQDHATLIVRGVLCNTTGNGSTGAFCRQLAIQDLIDVDFGNFPLGSHIVCTNSASIGILASQAGTPCINIRGGATQHISSNTNGYINYGSFTVNIVSAVTISFYLTADSGGIVGGGPMTFTGAANVTGQKYAIAGNSVVASGGAIFPGTIAGTVATGAQYT